VFDGRGENGGDGGRVVVRRGRKEEEREVKEFMCPPG
jgi:NAD(P)H-hydrate repair Nnr-like enzyme with NAD(P)H-hydrate epimerase domain